MYPSSCPNSSSYPSPSILDLLVQWARIRPSRYAPRYDLIYCTQGAVLVSQHNLQTEAVHRTCLPFLGSMSCWETRAVPCVQKIRAYLESLIRVHWTTGLQIDGLGYELWLGYELGYKVSEPYNDKTCYHRKHRSAGFLMKIRSYCIKLGQFAH